MSIYKQAEELTKQAEILKALAHPVRLCIVKNLISRGSCNVSTMQNCLDVPQSTVSQHLARLKAANIIKGERMGLEVNYNVINKIAIEIIDALDQLEK